MSKELAKFRRDQESIYFNNVEAYKASGKKLIEETHTTLARFYGSKPKNTYVIPNFSVGIRQVISLIPKKMKVLILDGDYPSLTSAFTESYHEVIKIPLQPEIEAAIEKQFQTNEINILALSIVQYATGLLIDFDFLKTLKENYPNLILIGDGTQFLGAHVFNFESSPFDVVAASGYKWMLAGFGNGVLMISDHYHYYVKKNSVLMRNKIFNGHFNILATASLNFAIQNFEKYGFISLMQKKAILTEKVKNQLLDYDLIDSWVQNRKHHSSIFILKGKLGLYKCLRNHKIQCVQRGKGVRISFHYYNTETDLKQLIKVLKKDFF